MKVLYWLTWDEKAEGRDNGEVITAMIFCKAQEHPHHRPIPYV
jgi:hypothetical protein